MPFRTPSYRIHKARNCAVVTISGHDHYLGEYDSPESWENYHRLVAEWLASRNTPPPQPAPAEKPPLTMAELILAYWAFVKSYYVKNGEPTSEQDTIRQALRFTRKLYGSTPAASFSPLALKAVREEMIRHPITRKFKVRDTATSEVREEIKVMRIGLARTFINKQVGRIKRMFSWAAENELLPASTFQALVTVRGLRRDRTTAREKEPVKPVSEEHVSAVLPLVPPVIRTMILVQRLCGGRPQDIVGMRPCDIDRSTGPAWEYRPGRHKNEHRGRDRIIFLGPKSQELLKPYLDEINSEDFVFSPRRAEAKRLAALRQRNGQPAVKPERSRGKWNLRDRYDDASYRRAIRRACERAGIPIWFPLQLRHSAGTAIRKKFGLEASQAVLGHSELTVTQVYSEVDLTMARRVMEEVG